MELLSSENINKTNFVQYFKLLKDDECDMTFRRLNLAYKLPIDMSIPLRMYLKKKLFKRQVSVCKHTSDLFVQLDRFVDASVNERAIPFAFKYVDSRVKTH